MGYIHTFDGDSNIEKIVDKEWLVTNGIGGYASSTVCGLNSRRYHGILIAAKNPPTQRRVLASKVEEIVQKENMSLALASNQYPGIISPDGYKYLTRFEKNPFPQMTFESGSIKISKLIFMPHGYNTTIIEYQNLSDEALDLKLTPFFADRDYHSLLKKSDYFNFYYTQEKNILTIYPYYGADALYFGYSQGTFQEERLWYYNMEYAQEQYRGLDYQEDGYTLGYITCTLEPAEKCYLVFSTDEEILFEEPRELKKKELQRINTLYPKNISYPEKQEPSFKEFIRELYISADQFIVKRESTKSFSIIAGYHWFTDWGRDTMISLPGLCLVTGRRQEAKSIIETFLKYIDRGMLPNFFPDSGISPEYNTVDASLWLFITLYEYYQRFKELDFIQEVMPYLKQIIEHHIQGTRFNIHITEEGFLYAGDKDIQLTWMDAKVGDVVITPRYGCPVEINVLWYNALKIYAYFGSELGIQQNHFQEYATKFMANFKRYFFNKAGYLHDVVIPNEFIDDTFRPNQIYAVSLPFSVLNREEEQLVVEHVQEKLVTPYGLKTLASAHPLFVGKYGGNQWERDSAYHQGTVWTFLLGEYYLAYLKVHDNSAKSKREVESALKPLVDHFYQDACIQSIAEIFDGEEPHKSRGCIAQAWSVGNLLKLIVKNNLFQ
ncbi:glycogen debranching enzyme N-terminal domain-containing protein [bacterium]|nr:glycogen debranching enzyme N-terminal domain-containing protein [bacterium]